MDVFVARQPIFDSALQVSAYELLHRSGLENRFDGTDATAATARVLADHALDSRLEVLTGGKPAFVNFPRDLLVGGYATLLPPDKLVIEILEDIDGDREVLAACADLKALGYRLALDDYAPERRNSPLLGVVDIIKVDFRATPPAERALLGRQMAGRGVDLVAEKIETRAEFLEAAALGYTHYQGYFFSEPVVVTGRKLGGSRRVFAEVLAAINRPELDFAEVEAAVKRDASLTDKLLRYVNSAGIGLRQRITSLQQALVLLGENQVRKWLFVAAFSDATSGKPQELLVAALTRAHMCELLARAVGGDGTPLDHFLTGMYSLIDAVLDEPLEQAVQDLPLCAEGKRALLGEHNRLRDVLDVVIAYERGAWKDLPSTLSTLSLHADDVIGFYFDALGAVGQLAAA
jgi:c-di-GMP-related signal transduction protein